MLVGVAQQLAAQPVQAGRVVLMFQPAEETGEGAARVVADPGWAQLAPDRVFAFHNLPGQAEGLVSIKQGSFTCASRGMAVALQGVTR